MLKHFNFYKSHENNKYIQVDVGDVWFKTQARVLYADTDSARVLYHANYLKYFEIGRGELYRDFGYAYKKLESENYYHPIINVNLNYYAPACYDDLLDIYIRPQEIKTVNFTFEYKILNSADNKYLTDGITAHCSTKGKRPCEVDEVTKNIFKKYNDKQK